MSSLDRATSASCVRLHELRRFRLGELDVSRAGEIEAHCAGCNDCRARLEDIDRTDRLFREQNDAAIASAQILALLDAPQKKPRFRFAGWLVPIAAAAALAFAVILLPQDPQNRMKGGGEVGLEMYVKRHEGPEKAPEGIGLTAGDQIQFRYVAGGHPWVLILSVDGRGAITALYPADGGESVPIAPSGSHVLEGSIILDDAVGAERVLAFFSDRPLAFSAIRPKVEKAVKAAGGDLKAVHGVDLEEGGEGVVQATFWFLKM